MSSSATIIKTEERLTGIDLRGDKNILANVFNRIANGRPTCKFVFKFNGGIITFKGLLYQINFLTV
jgi:hypothetical protein